MHIRAMSSATRETPRIGSWSKFWTDLPDSIETNRKKGSKLHSQRVTPRPGLALGDRSRAGQSRKRPRVPIDQLPGGDEFAELRGDDFAGAEVLRRLQVDEGRWQPQSNPDYGYILLVRRVTRTKSLKALGAKVAL